MRMRHHEGKVVKEQAYCEGIGASPLHLVDCTLDYLQQLFIEQTSPAEVTLLILVCIAGCLFLVSVLYVLSMLISWRLSSRRPFQSAMVPFSLNRQMKEQLGGYGLLALTALTIGMTFGNKHDLIEKIKDYPLSNLSTSSIESVIPMRKFPQAEDIKRFVESGLGITNDDRENMKSFARKLEILENSVSERSIWLEQQAQTLLKPLLEVGDIEAARALTARILDNLKTRPDAPSSKWGLLPWWPVCSVIILGVGIRPMAWLKWCLRLATGVD